MAGELAGDSGTRLAVAMLLGRHHLYEGWTPDEAVFGVRLLGTLGVRRLVLTAAVGAMHPGLRVGDFLRIDDQLNLTGASPLEGPEPGPEPRFPDMTRAWDEELGAALARAAGRLGMPLLSGVYAGVRGPQFETPAEIRMLRTLGADVVGMSVVHEAIAARHLGIRLAGLAFASNLAAGMGEGPLDAAHVNEAAARAVPDLVRLLGAAAERAGSSGGSEGNRSSPATVTRTGDAPVLQRADVGKVAVAAGVIEAVTHEEPVGHDETREVGLDGDPAAGRLREQRRGTDGAGRRRLHRLEQRFECDPRIHDVLHDHHVAVGEGFRVVELDRRSPGLGTVAVGRHPAEVHRYLGPTGVELANQIRREDEGSTQHHQQVQVPAGVRRGDLLREGLHAGGDGAGREDLGRIRHRLAARGSQCP